jgi:Protein of unknown function, DUF547
MKKTILSVSLFLSVLSISVSQNNVKHKSGATCTPSRSKVVKKTDSRTAVEAPMYKEETMAAVVDKTTSEKVNTPVSKTEAPLDVAEKPATNITQTTTTKVTEMPIKSPIATPIAHEDFDVLLKKHVSATGKVNYKGFKEDKAALENYITWLSENTPTAQTSKNEKLAYWINAYNALTIKLILDNYPLPKITNLDGGKTWDVKRFTLGGKKYSLNDIENTIIRPMGEPRIHFALNCAAKSCPPLFNEVFTAEKLNAQLEARTRKFVNNLEANNLKGNEIKISNIFNWYGKDFDNVLNFINKYAAVKVKSDVKIGFGEYDWRLNE